MRPKIIAAEIPRHEENLTRVAPPVFVAFVLVIAALLTTPAPADAVPHLEIAHALLERADARREACQRAAPMLMVPQRRPMPQATITDETCRFPDPAAMLAWFKERVQPVALQCGASRGKLMLTFDRIGRVSNVELDDAPLFATCAMPKLRVLARPDVANLSFIFPVSQVADGA